MKSRQTRRWLGILTVLVMLVALMSGSVVAAAELESYKHKPKVKAVDDQASTHPGEEITIDVLANDDIDGRESLELRITDITQPKYGKATISQNSQYIIYTADKDYIGKVCFQYVAAAYYGRIPVAQDTATVTIHIKPINNPPQAKSQAILNHMNQPIDINLQDLCEDEDGDELTFRIAVAPSHGTVVLNGVVATYTPNTDYIGKDFFIYAVSDGMAEAKATIKITMLEPENNPPIAKDYNTSLETNTTLKLHIIEDIGCSDPDANDTLRIEHVGAAQNGRTSSSGQYIYYGPAEDFHGSDSFTYTITDGKDCSSATITVTVIQPNRPPVAKDISVETLMEQQVIIDVLPHCSDPDQDQLTLKSVSTPEEGTARIENGVIVYTPKEGFAGQDQFEYTITDGKDCSSATITVTVIQPNRPPVAKDISVETLMEQQVIIDVLPHCSDPDQDQLTLKSVSTPEEGEARIENGVIVYTPKEGFTGQDQFAYTVCDGELTASGIITVTVKSPVIPKGSLTIQKRIEGGGNPDDRFEILIIPVGTELQQIGEPIYISFNEPWTGQLEPGDYQVQEASMPEGYFFEEMTNNGEISIEAGKEYVITIVNRYEPEPGTLIIRKQISGSGYSRNAQFQVTIEPDDDSLPELATEVKNIHISVNEPWEGQLPPGNYRVREVEMPSSRYSLVGITNDGIVEIISGETVEVVITNRYRAPVIPPDPDPEPPQEPEEPTEPEEPSEPEVPEEPEVPVEPEEPEEPAEPEEPEVPDEPSEPEVPEEPEVPVEPEEPEEPAEPEEPPLPKTSGIDNTLILGAILTLSGFWLSRKRN